METRDYIDAIKDQLTGFGVLASELPNSSLKRIVNTALKELNRYYNETELKSVSGESCIDLSKYPEINNVVNVYRAAGVGYPQAGESGGEGDPTFMSQLQMFNFGSSYYNSDWLYNYGSYSSAQRISNTISTDLMFKEDKLGRKLYVNLPQGIPNELTLEYIPVLRDASQIKGEYWQDILLKLSLAHAKIALGRIRTRFKQSQNLWDDDGDTMLNEGNTELANLREQLRKSNDLFIPLD